LHVIDIHSGAASVLTNDISGCFDPGVSAAGEITSMRQESFSYLSVIPGPRRVSFCRQQFGHALEWAKQRGSDVPERQPVHAPEI